ncbi:MAG: YcxB family protein [Oscillospiraceae bacterium]|jgi:hypothetical protein|nr:YcxB family protein [Oscillospiraceae bacterium]
MLSISYDVTIPEIETAYKAFWKKYGLAKSGMMSAAYIIGIALFINILVKDSSSLLAWTGLAVASGMLFAMWLRPSRARKKLVAALEQMYEERYSASFGDDKIEIETFVMDEGDEKTDKTEINTATEELFSKENGEMFMLFVNRALIFIFPKRCLTDAQSEDLRKYFEEKGI